MLLGALAMAGCDALTPSGPAEEEVLDGTIEGMTGSQVGQHLAGDEEFGRVFAEKDGLGPIFVASSCERCHAGDGKGHPVFNLVRFGRPGPSGFDPMIEFGGPQLQHRSIAGYPAEAVPVEAVGVSKFNPPAVTGLGFLDAVADATLIALADPADAASCSVSLLKDSRRPQTYPWLPVPPRPCNSVLRCGVEAGAHTRSREGLH